MIEQVTADVVAAAEAALRDALRDIARQMMRMIAELNTVNGRLVPDQGRQLLALDEEVRSMLESRASPVVLDELTERLRSILEASLQDHPGLGAYRPELTNDLVAVMRGQAAEIADAIESGGRDAIMNAVVRSVSSSTPVADLAGPVADALETTRQRAVTAVNRAVREFHESTLKRMGGAQEEEFAYVYLGPGEGSRPYCLRRVGKALTQRAADALDPRERFNCRHSLAPIPMSMVEDEGLELFDEPIPMSMVEDEGLELFDEV